MTRVKVCGITRNADRNAAIEAGADALGFLVDVPVDTDRELTPEAAAALIDDGPPFVTSVLVTMPAGPDRALELLERTGAEAIQLHNDLPVDAVAAVSEATSASVIKAIDAEPAAAERYAPVVDALLVDSRTESGAGGTGRRSDWDRAAAVRNAVDCPVVLAGGLDPGNVADGVAAVEPFAVDVSSGVERTEGRKDPEAVR
ncbi:MAG: phosphoribosylanthranilate isomerase, partial [Halobacteriales archaeon]